MTNKDLGLEKIKDLVSRFNEQLPEYKKSEYSETQTRRDFIDPFFKALGWDIDNEKWYAESYREVIHEDKLKVGKATKAPDYSFRLGGGQRLFFVEAKKPCVFIKDDIQSAYQVRRYGWSAKLNVSIITDFEEFAIYDCNKKPNQNDKSSVARIKYITFNEYEKEWDFLWNTFSKEAVLKGGLDKFIVSNANKKGTSTVDKEFLISLDEWRTLLAENLSKENKHLSEEELNFVVQQTLDRIIFLRICEDRNIEPYGSLQQTITNKQLDNFYKNLLDEFKLADKKYNSGLFDFKKDSISQQLTISNKTLTTIINQLYYPECPYEFSVLSVEILGSAYEQFLGKTITINNKGKSVIELKPEVRKAGGVYYTPQYIVDYIVTNTVGKITTGLNPLQVEEIKIVDPACGSGSFLLGAYQYLLNWHKDYYTQNPSKKNPLTPEGNLTTTEKKKILINNIYGVDIDTNAVEVTKLSLLLKCMEGETQASIEHLKSMFKERVLPTLDNNIKSGNSLIDTDYYENQIDFGEERKIKPFNWQQAFPEVFKPRGANSTKFLDSINYRLGLDTLNSTMDLNPKNSTIGLTTTNLTMGLTPKNLSKGLNNNNLTMGLTTTNSTMGFNSLPENHEEKIEWHFITFVTHNSRISERMITYNSEHFIKNLKPYIFEIEQRKLITELIIQQCIKHKIKVAALNVLPDHVHIIISGTDKNDIDKKVKLIKGGSSFLYQKKIKQPNEKNIWAQKYHYESIQNDKSFYNILEYINNNHYKHSETWGIKIIKEYEEILKPIIEKIIVEKKVIYEYDTKNVVDSKIERIDNGFKLIVNKGGFDVVIGNPPYVSTKEIAINQKQYFAKKYQVAIGQFDLYILFIEKSFSLLTENGLTGMITSNTFINNKDAKKLREIILYTKNINEIINLGETVFDQANLDVSILILKNKLDTNIFSKIITNDTNFKENRYYTINQTTWLNNNSDFLFNINISNKDLKILNKLFANKIPISNFLDFPRGIEIGGNSELISKVKTKKSVPIIYGRNINKYQIVFNNNFIEFDNSNKSVFKDFSIYNQEKILIQRIRNLSLKQRIVATIDNSNFVCTNTLRIGILKDTKLSIKYLLGLLNSKTINWIFLKKFLNKDIYAYQLEQIPIRTIDFSNKQEAQSHDQIVYHVEQLLELNKTMGLSPLANIKEQINQKIQYHEDKVNTLVYELYNLNEDEIKLIENY